MGAAVSSNTAQEISQITNSISHSTTANATEVSNLRNQITTDGCTLQSQDGSVNMNVASQNVIQNKQIVKAINTTNVNNTIQQKMMQTAASKVGAMGIGYADASNSASVTSDSSTTIQSTVGAVAAEYSDQDNSITCINSKIIAKNDINLSILSSSNLLSDQVVKSQEVDGIVNNIDQSVSQKATATVAGIGGLILAIAVLIGAVGYTLAKPLTTGPVKGIIAIVVVVLLVIVAVVLYMMDAPPIFNQDNTCTPGSNIGGCSADCINQSQQTIYLKKAPLKYLVPIFSEGTDSSLARMAIVAAAVGPNAAIDASPGNNGGYNKQVSDALGRRWSELINEIGNPSDGVSIPPLLVATSYKIPNEYLLEGGETRLGICTPGIIQISEISGTVDWSNTPCDQDNIGAPQSAGNAADNEVLANFNAQEWKTWLDPDNEEIKKERFAYARLFLSMIVAPDMDLGIYIYDYEYVSYKDDSGKINYMQVSKIPSVNTNKYVRLYTPNSEYPDISQPLPADTAGTLKGVFGVCNDKTYNVHNFFRKIGVWLLLSLAIIAIIFTMFWGGKDKAKQDIGNLISSGK